MTIIVDFPVCMINAGVLSVLVIMFDINALVVGTVVLKSVGIVILHDAVVVVRTGVSVGAHVIIVCVDCRCFNLQIFVLKRLSFFLFHIVVV